jgi:hypothetical protein
MWRSLKCLWRSANDTLVALDQRAHSGNRYARPANWVIIVLFGVPAALVCGAVCWTITDMLVPVVAGTGYHLGAIWAASRHVVELSGVIDHCDAERILNVRRDLLETFAFLFASFGTGPALHRWYVSGIRPELMTQIKRWRWFFVMYALIVALWAVNQPITYGTRPVEQHSWCDYQF